MYYMTGRRDGCQQSILQKIIYLQYVSYPRDQLHQKADMQVPFIPKIRSLDPVMK